jgi:hypothetical protein
VGGMFLGSMKNGKRVREGNSAIFDATIQLLFVMKIHFFSKPVTVPFGMSAWGFAI